MIFPVAGMNTVPLDTASQISPPFEARPIPIYFLLVQPVSFFVVFVIFSSGVVNKCVINDPTDIKSKDMISP